MSEAYYPVNRTEVKLDGICGGSAANLGKTSCAGIDCCQRYHIIKPNRICEPEAGQGTVGGSLRLDEPSRFTGITDNSGPMITGSSVYDKALTTRKTECRKNV